MLKLLLYFLAYLYLKPSSWKWTHGFEICRRYRKE